ncbi:hypothetical protein [Blautia difficilis]|uniref:hypothetical protein n=1 Tax=Blautia difficilis TaxID=2763027 RepID=UPI0002DA5856|nr:hypothetical protein [Blautia difficilis]
MIFRHCFGALFHRTSLNGRRRVMSRLAKRGNAYVCMTVTYSWIRGKAADWTGKGRQWKCGMRNNSKRSQMAKFS